MSTKTPGKLFVNCRLNHTDVFKLDVKKADDSTDGCLIIRSYLFDM